MLLYLSEDFCSILSIYEFNETLPFERQNKLFATMNNNIDNA